MTHNVHARKAQMNCSPAIYGTTSLTCGSKNLSSPSKSARTRSKSESCCDSESTVFPSRRSDAYLLHNGSPTHDSYSVAMTKDECQTAIPRGKKRRFPLPYKLMCINANHLRDGNSITLLQLFKTTRVGK